MRRPFGPLRFRDEPLAHFLTWMFGPALAQRWLDYKHLHRRS